MISVGAGGKINVAWVQNGIKNKKEFRSVKEAERYQELLDDIQDSIKLCEEGDKFNRDINYDPNIVQLKAEKAGKELDGFIIQNTGICFALAILKARREDKVRCC